jgi:retinol-binding protein 3
LLHARACILRERRRRCRKKQGTTCVKNGLTFHSLNVINHMRLARFPVCAVAALSVSHSALLGSSPTSLRSSGVPISVDSTVDAATRNAVINAALKALNDGYIFPDIAAQIERDIRARMASGEYDSLSDAQRFASALTSDLRNISHDKHIVVQWSEHPILLRSDGPPSVREAAAEKERERKASESINFGFRTVERLSGNVGYLDLTYFDRPEFGKSTAAAAMLFLRHTDALIIDLTDNDGGRPEMVSLLISYLMPKQTPLTGIFRRRDRRVAPSSTVPVPDSLKYLGKPVYLLTSNAGTISAGEAFVYDLQLLKRATVVGEVSAGAANPGSMVGIGEHFQLFVPSGRAVSPITGTNWEGTGIKPDIEVPASKALKTAHLEALRALEKKAVDPDRKKYLRATIDAVEKN